MDAGRHMLKLKNLTVKIGDKTILQDINFNFEKGKIYAILGPNGSGKSTLAYSLIGHPNYEYAKESKIVFKKEDITDLSADKRAQKGIFLSFQTPLSIPGVKVNEILQLAVAGAQDPLSLRENINKTAEKLKINKELLNRSLNDGASGGERKKMEVLQAAILNRDLQIYDEVDTGVDVDSMRILAEFLHDNKKNKTYIIITHYDKILRLLKPDTVIILLNGSVKKVGKGDLVSFVEKNGYEKFK